MNTKEIILVIIGVLAGALIGVFVMMGARPDIASDIATLKTQLTTIDNKTTALQTQLSALETKVAVNGAEVPKTRTVNEAAADSDFYLVTFDKTNELLEKGLQVEVTEDITKALTTDIPATIVDETALKTALEDKESNTFATLKFIYDSLLTKRTEGSASPVSTCIALENDIYSGTVLYFYIQVPTADRKAMGIPADWKLLDGPLPESQTVVTACYEGEEEVAQ